MKLQKAVKNQIYVDCLLLFVLIFGILDLFYFDLMVMRGWVGEIFGILFIFISVIHVEFVVNIKTYYESFVFSISNGRGQDKVDGRTLLSSMFCVVLILCWLFIMETTELFILYVLSYYSYSVLFVISGRGEERI